MAQVLLIAMNAKIGMSRLADGSRGSNASQFPVARDKHSRLLQACHPIHPLNQFIGPPLSILPPLAIVSFPYFPRSFLLFPTSSLRSHFVFLSVGFPPFTRRLVLDLIKEHRRRANSIRLHISRQVHLHFSWP